MKEKTPKSISRRAFLKATAAAGAIGAVTLAGCQQKSPPEPHTPTVIDEPEPEVVVKRSWCGVCSANCAMQVQTVDGKIVAIKGNPEDQVGAGKLCVKGYSSWKMLYDPERLKYPMKRTNPEKGPDIDPGFVKISWDEAFQITAEKFNEIIETSGPQAIVLAGRPHDFVERWAKAMGTPNLSRHHGTCYSTHDAVWKAVVSGSGRPWTQDLENAKYILSFGWDQPAKGKNMAAREYIKALEKGAKAVVINPMLTATGAMAHEWIPIKPGTDLAFLLAMIHVIVNEELYNKEYVESYTLGIDDVKKAVKSYTPAWAAGITEVDAGTIERIAREFATTPPALIPTHKRDAGGPNYENGWRCAFAFVILNALVGSIDRPGGVIFQRNPKMPSFDEVFAPPEFPEIKSSSFTMQEKHNKVYGKKARSGHAELANAILSEKPYPIRGLFVRKHNILSYPNATNMTEALKKLEFLVVAEILPVEMVQMADVVFPEPHFLETEGIAPRTYNGMWPQLAYREPTVEKLGDTKGLGAIITGIAKAMGLEAYFEGVSGTKLMEEQMKALGSTLDELKADPSGLWGAEQSFKPKEEFGTESKKIELHSPTLKSGGFDPFPTWQEKREKPTNEYPLFMLVTRHPSQRMTESQNNELVMQVAGECSAVINKDTAAQLGIKNGEEVLIESKIGKITATARVVEGIRPDCVSIYHGFGHWSKALPRAYGVGGNDGDLVYDFTYQEMLDRKDPGHGALMNDMCVKVSRA